MQIQTGSVSLSPISGSGPQLLSTTVTMPAAISHATAILTGFLVEFSGGNDHHLGQLDIQVNIPSGGISGANVAVQATIGLRDWSGNWDDQYDGQVFFTVVGE
ncbi:MAG TPA: hypothetical protein VMI94_19535 [Bryobacteraceae bacterium]|nr:hypothetical protein [Bryobacteraceae bacterium]